MGNCWVHTCPFPLLCCARQKRSSSLDSLLTCSIECHGCSEKNCWSSSCPNWPFKPWEVGMGMEAPFPIHRMPLRVYWIPKCLSTKLDLPSWVSCSYLISTLLQCKAGKIVPWAKRQSFSLSLSPFPPEVTSSCHHVCRC